MDKEDRDNIRNARVNLMIDILGSLKHIHMSEARRHSIIIDAAFTYGMEYQRYYTEFKAGWGRLPKPSTRDIIASAVSAHSEQAFIEGGL